MKITVYTISGCQFSKQEKEYLTANKLAFEEKNLETNKDFLTEMLAISNNFAGTPVTRVEKDDGSIVVLKGFTKEEFDTTFGFIPSAATNQSPATMPSANAGQINKTPSKVEEVKPAGEVVPPVETVPPAPIPIGSPDLTNSTNSTDSTTPSDPLKSVMDDLQSKSQQTEQPTMPPAPPEPATTPTAEQPTAPPAGSPTIPDFPAK